MKFDLKLKQSSGVSNAVMRGGSTARSLIWWSLVPLAASQIMRLHHNDAASWLFWDYAGRIAALAVLAAAPSAWAAAFRTSRRQISLPEVTLWIVGICLLDRFLQLPRYLLDAAFPATVLGTYPHSTGWLRSFDLTFGLALVAASEEIIFRRYLREAFRPYLGDGILVVLTTSILFGAYHWWTGFGNVLAATTLGIFLMLMLRRSGTLWPVVLAHYLVDLINFA
jgi:hypothetical protein